MHFFCYGLVPFLGKYPLLLSYWGERWVYVKLVDHGIHTDPWHVLVAPSEDIPIVF